MQPDQDLQHWQQPPAHPSQSPYAIPADELPVQQTPVVTMTPEPSLPPIPVTLNPGTTDEIVEREEAPVLSDEPIHWQAHEHIDHERHAGWFIIFSLVVLVFIAIAIFVIHSWTFAILVPVMAAALLVYVRRPPRLIDYTLSAKGLFMNDQLYPFGDFKSFGVVHDGHQYSVMLIPVKRFRLGVWVYFPEEVGEKLVDIFGARLPMQDLKLDVIDRLILKLRI